MVELFDFCVLKRPWDDVHGGEVDEEGNGEAQRQVEDPYRAERGSKCQTGWNEIGDVDNTKI